MDIFWPMVSVPKTQSSRPAGACGTACSHCSKLERARQVLGPNYHLQTVTPTPTGSTFSSKGPQPPRVLSPAGENHPPLSCESTCQNQAITEMFSQCVSPVNRCEGMKNQMLSEESDVVPSSSSFDSFLGLCFGLVFIALCP